MSDTERQSFDDTRYSTPVPELDDHRAQSASVQKPTRARRGTADTLYASAALRAPDLAHVNEVLLQNNSRDLEEAVIDEEPDVNRSRRPTVTTLSPRSESPPNSVKAFAEARQRNRDEENALQRTFSTASRRSNRTYQSRRYTNENDAASVAEEDVCFPLPASSRNNKQLKIDYDLLDDFIASEERDYTPPKNQPKPRVCKENIFNDLRAQSNSLPSRCVTVDGDLITVPSDDVSLKEEQQCDEKSGSHHHTSQNRFTFFSSAWDSILFAPEFKDLLYDGENVRGLFSLPDDDGVWWLNINNPTNEEINVICRSFGIHPLTTEDIKTQEAREKIELFPSYYFACFRSFHTHAIPTSEGENVEHELEPFNIYVIVFREGTLSFSFSPNVHAENVRKRISTLKDWLTLSSDWICYALM